MPQYVVLLKLTAKGLEGLKDAPARIDAGIKAVEGAGGKVHSFHVTMGQYDYVSVVEGPNDEFAAAMAMGLAVQGFVATETMRAFTPGEFAGIVGQLP